MLQTPRRGKDRERDDSDTESDKRVFVQADNWNGESTRLWRNRVVD